MSEGIDAILDGDSSGSESLDDELGIPSVRTPGVQRARVNAKTPLSDPVVRRSSRVRYPIKRFGFEGYAAHHYAYMVKLVEDVEPTRFEGVVGHTHWDAAIVTCPLASCRTRLSSPSERMSRKLRSALPWNVTGFVI